MKQRLAWVFLLLIAAAAGVAWNREAATLEGAAWIAHPYLSVPLAAAAYLTWIGFFAPTPNRTSSVLLVFFLGVLGFLAAGVLGIAMPLFFTLATSGDERGAFLGTASLLLFPVVWLLIPLGTNFIGRIFVGTRRGGFLGSTLLFLLAWPGVLLLARVVPGAPPLDGVSALRSGLIIPPLIVALGIPFLPRKRSRRELLP